MGENKKKGKSKMLLVTFLGLTLVAAGIKIADIIREKMDKKKNDNHEDYYG